MGDFTARVVDTTQGAIRPFRASNSASLGTTVSNGSARGVSAVRNVASSMKGRATGLFSRLRSSKETAEVEKDVGPADEGAFNAAQREYEPELFAEIREGWVRRHMLARVEGYMRQDPLDIRVLTWNVAAKKPPGAEDLRKMFTPLLTGCSIIAIGLQVCPLLAMRPAAVSDAAVFVACVPYGLPVAMMSAREHIRCRHPSIASASIRCPVGGGRAQRSESWGWRCGTHSWECYPMGGGDHPCAAQLDRCGRGRAGTGSVPSDDGHRPPTLRAPLATARLLRAARLFRWDRPAWSGRQQGRRGRKHARAFEHALLRVRTHGVGRLGGRGTESRVCPAALASGVLGRSPRT